MQQAEIDIVVAKTKKWIVDVVVGCNFCPFAAKEIRRDSIRYQVLENATVESTLLATIEAFDVLNSDVTVETLLLVLPNAFETFTEYLDIVDKAEALLEKENYEGIYQIASFHPQYIFAGSTNLDPSNYTNRSPYPMLHFLREESVSKAIDSYPDVDDVPDNNIAYAHEKGLRYMQTLFNNIK